MNRPQFDIENVQIRKRVSTLFRMILAIPHLLVVEVWGSVIQLVTFFQWWIILFTGKRNNGIWSFQNSWLGYSTRVNSYFGLLFDKWPAFGDTPGGEPTTYSFEYESKARKVSTFFRLILAIPAFFIYLFLTFVGVMVTIGSWFVIMFTGRHPQGMFDFLLKVRRYSNSLSAYTMLMTDAYPSSEQDSAALVRENANWNPPSV